MDLPLLISLITLTPIIVSCIFFLRKNRKKLIAGYKYSTSRFFYKDSLVKEMLYNYEAPRINKDFIKYSDILHKGYYQHDTLNMAVKKDNGDCKVIRLPYKELINFTKAPEASVRITNYQNIPNYRMDKKIVAATNWNLETYLQVKPLKSKNKKFKLREVISKFLQRKQNQTFNGNILRLADFQEKAPNTFECEVEKAKFYDLIRTNLTLDLPFKGDGIHTLRMQDLSEDQHIRPLKESVMANFIGVSAIWCICNNHNKITDRVSFYLKPRQSNLSVFSDMLGTISGYVIPPAKAEINQNLLEYIGKELKREFSEETGYLEYLKKNGKKTSSPDIEFIPLAMTREFIRGGNPQFFYLIKTPYISDKDFAKYFSRSKDGKNEFQDGKISNIKNYPLSPETALNLLYCYQYLQRKEYLDFISL